MKKYYDILVRLAKAKEDLKQHKRKLHTDFKEKHKKIFKAMDILVIILILCNFGAAFTTEALVAKKNIDAGKVVRFREANPIVAETRGYEEHPEAQRMIYILLKTSLIWTILTGIYIYFRNTMFTNSLLLLIVMYLIYYSYIVIGDFLNNFGLLIVRQVFM